MSMSQKMILSLNPVQKHLNNVKIPDDFCGFVKITEKPAPTWVWISAHLGIDFSQLKNPVESEPVKKEEPQEHKYRNIYIYIYTQNKQQTHEHQKRPGQSGPKMDPS